MKIKKLMLIGVVAICVLTIFSCQKELIDEQAIPDPPEIYPSPFTEQLWTADTFVVTEPATYESLNESDKTTFGAMGNWWIGAKLLFKNNGAAQSNLGDWDFGFVSWRLINRGKDIEVLLFNSKDTLIAWKMDGNTFSYQKRITPTMQCTFLYKTD